MSHNHSHNVGSYNRAFALGILLNIIFVVIEAGYGIFANSLALLADAGHNLSDVVGLLLAWGAMSLASKAATEKRTYGFKKATVIASLASAILLLIALGGITWEAIGRFQNPQPIEGMTVIVVAGIGVLINTFTALLFVKGQKSDLNIRGAFLHMAVDAGVSLGVVVAGILILVYGWQWADPVISLMIVVVVFISTWGLLRDSMNYGMDAVPNNIHVTEIKRYLMNLKNVNQVHDLHVWPLSTTEIALTVHLVVDVTTLDNKFLSDIQQHMHDSFGIAHATVQVETSTGDNNCMLEGSKCV